MTKLDIIGNQQEAQMLRAFLDAVADIKNQTKITQLTVAIERGDIDGAIRLLGLDPAAFEGMDESLRQAYRTGGFTGAAQFGSIPTPDGDVLMRFNMRSPAAEEWLRVNSSQLITDMVEGQQEMVRQVLTDDLAKGINPKQSALDLIGRMDNTGQRRGGFIGLTPQQTGWVLTARQELNDLNPNYFNRKLRDKRLDGVIRRAMNSDTPLTPAQINRAVTRLQGRTLKYRGDVIARTESINALRAGQDQSIDQAIERAELDARDAKGTWDSSGPDGHTRDSHLLMEGQERMHGVPFDFVLSIGQAMYPGDASLGAEAKELIQCRCRKNTTIDFIGRLKRIEGFR